MISKCHSYMLPCSSPCRCRQSRRDQQAQRFPCTRWRHPALTCPFTLGTVVREVQDLPQDASMQDIAKAITHGSLMGARGNSGVITSQILRGIAEGLCDVKKS